MRFLVNCFISWQFYTFYQSRIIIVTILLKQNRQKNAVPTKRHPARSRSASPAGLRLRARAERDGGAAAASLPVAASKPVLRPFALFKASLGQRPPAPSSCKSFAFPDAVVLTCTVLFLLSLSHPKERDCLLPTAPEINLHYGFVPGEEGADFHSLPVPNRYLKIIVQSRDISLV